MRKPTVSVVIATFNSEKILPKVLKALVGQTYPNEKMEILIVDGGSKDSTISIAKKHHAVFINNYRTDPIYAKYLGFVNSQGKYLLFLDHDEVLASKRSVQRRVNVFESSKEIKILVGSGYKSPKDYPFISNYINEFGDPFSYFIYRLSKDSRFLIKTMKKRFVTVRENKDFITFDIKSTSQPFIFEIVAAGGMIDLDYVRNNFKRLWRDSMQIPHISNYILSRKSLMTILKNDVIYHYSSVSFSEYFKKIDWRVRNNVYFKSSLGKSGYSAREKLETRQGKYKKLLFIPYNLLVLPVLFDSVYLSIARRDFRYMIHLALSMLTAAMILFHTLLNELGYKPVLKNYDGSLKHK